MNTEVRIARLPQGLPQEADFELLNSARPQPGPGQFLVRTRWLSLDPKVRSLLSGRHFLHMPRVSWLTARMSRPGAPAQFCRLMRGENFGKTLVRVD